MRHEQTDHVAPLGSAAPEAVVERQANQATEAAGPADAPPSGAIDPMQSEAWAELRDLIARAKKGDVSALPRLREYLRDNEFLWRTAGDIGLHAQAAWAKLSCGPNLHLQECLVRRANALKDELAGEASSPIEKLLIERVVMGMLQLGHLEAREAQRGENELRWAEYQRRRQDQAFRQYMTSLNALATLRRLVPQRTVYVPVMQQPEPIHGTPEPAPVRNGQHMLNGRSKLNGHDRFGHLLETVGAAGDG